MQKAAAGVGPSRRLKIPEWAAVYRRKAAPAQAPRSKGLGAFQSHQSGPNREGLAGWFRRWGGGLSA